MGLVRPALLRAGAAMVGCVHDELVVECPEDRANEVCAAVVAAMEDAGREMLHPVPVAAEAGVGMTWADKV